MGEERLPDLAGLQPARNDKSVDIEDFGSGRG